MSTDQYIENVIKAAQFLKSQADIRPVAGIINGTGLCTMPDNAEIIRTFEYSQIPGFPVSTVQGHAGRLVLCRISGKPVMMMQGRFHLYEGYSPEEVCFPVRVMQESGVETLILTNASGGINPGYACSDIMVIKDHINLTGHNPLTGPNHDAWGIRFPDMSRVYDPGLAGLADKTGKNLNLPIKQGVYAGLAGPSLETPAETRFLKTIGADAVGFSTIMEAIAGVHAEMKILGLSLITNINNPDSPEPVTLESVLETAAEGSEALTCLICDILAEIS